MSHQTIYNKIGSGFNQTDKFKRCVKQKDKDLKDDIKMRYQIDMSQFYKLIQKILDEKDIAYQ